MSDHEKLPLSGDDLKKALRDAYGQGRVYGRQQKYPETPEITNAPRDAWIRQYIARLLAVTPITTAPTPTDRVGEDVFAYFDEANYKPDLASAIAVEVMSLPWTHAVLASDDIQDEMKAQEAHCNRYGEVQEVVSAVLDRARTTPHKIMITAISETVAEAATLAAQAGADSTAVLSGSAADAIAPAAPAPSDPAGAGGDLGELERLSAIQWRKPEEAPENRPVLVAGGVAIRRDGAWYSITGQEWPGRPIQWEVVAWAELPSSEDVASIAKLMAHRSGQLVASTPGQKGAGEEKTGASFGPGSREPGPLVPAFGFDPSRVERAAQAAWEHQGDKIDPASPEANETWVTTNESARNLWRSIAEVMLTAADGDHHGR